MFDVKVSVSGARFGVFEPSSNVAARFTCASNGFKQGHSLCVTSHRRIIEVLASFQPNLVFANRNRRPTNSCRRYAAV